MDNPHKDDTHFLVETAFASLGETDETLARSAVKKVKAYKKNQAIRDQKLYTLGGEIFSAITHGITAATGLAIMIMSIIFAVSGGHSWVIVTAVAIYGFCSFVGFTLSTVYHSLAINKGKRVMRVLDHCSIFFIIAGTYTPIVLVGIGGWVGWALFGAVWGMAIVGTTLTAINLQKFKTFAFISFIVMGWTGLLAIYPLVQSIGFGASFWLLLGGGIAYTLGAVVYKMKGKYMHGVWHLFTLAGLVCHFLCIMFLL